jgi:hypothetical protein
MSYANSVISYNQDATIAVDLHGYHPDDITGATLEKIVQQAWETGAERIRLIHGHGYNRGISPGFMNTNTGYFGLRIRGELRCASAELRRWIKHTTLCCSDCGATTVKLKPNPAPTRTVLDSDVLPESSIPCRRGRW